MDNRRARHDYHLPTASGRPRAHRNGGQSSGWPRLAPAGLRDVRNGRPACRRSHLGLRPGNVANHDPDHRKLLLHRNEVDSLAGKVAQKGLTLVPTKLYFKNGRAKVELALARGKEGRDKRRDIAKREADRDMQRAIKARR